MWLMDDVTIRDDRARDIRIWQINSQNLRVRKIWKKWFLDMAAFSWQNATYTIQLILTIYINNEKLTLPGRCAPVEFFSWKCGKLRKTAKSGYPTLIWPFRTSLFSALSWNKISHMKLQSLKMFKTTNDMFYKQFEFFTNWQGQLWGFVTLVLWVCRKIDHGQPRSSFEQIWFVVHKYLMLHTKFWPFGSREEDFLRFLPYMGMVAILVMWPRPLEKTFLPPEIWFQSAPQFLRKRSLKMLIWVTIWTNFRSPSHRSSKWNLTLVGSVVSEEKMFKKCGRRRPTYPISSPISLRLRWANKYYIFYEMGDTSI